MRRPLTVAIVILLLTAGATPVVGAGVQDSTQPTASERASPGQTASGLSGGATGQATPGIAGAVNSAAASNGTTVTILTYNDIQTAIAQNGTTPRMATLLDERRTAHDNPTFVVGGGDQVSPHSLAPITQWREPVAVLNEINPDADVIGNHDLDFGFDAVSEFAGASEFPWLMANVVQEDSGDPIPGTQPYTVVERDGVSIGVVGIADEAIKSKTAVDFDEAGYVVEDHVEVASEYATMLKEERGVDVVVVAAHVGIPESKEIAEGTDDVDLIVAGDDEVRYEPQETAGTVIVEAKARAEYVGEVNLTVSNGEVVDWDGRLWAVDESIPNDEAVTEVIERRRDEGLSEVVGTTDVALDSRFSSNYHDETALGNMITDAFRWKTGAEVAITNAGGIRSNAVYGPGEITAGDVYSMLPFGNTLVTVELTGAEIKQLLASQVVTMESETGQQYGPEAQLQVSGVTYEWASHENATPTIRDVRINGEPLDEDATYTVTVNSYMKGWDGSVLENASVVDRTKALYGTVVAEYITAQETVSPEDHNRIRRTDVEVGTLEMTLDGEGTVEVNYDLPDAVESVNASTVYATTAANATVEPTDVAVADGVLTLTFEDSALLSLAEHGGDVQIYAKYDDARYSDQRVYFEQSVLNAELDASIQEATPTPTQTQTPTQSETSPATSTDAPAETTTTAVTTATSPGFGLVAGLVALLGAALLAGRRD